MKHLTAPHSFEGVQGIKGRHRIAELDEVEIADGLGAAIEETLERIAKSGDLDKHEAGLADLLGAAWGLHQQMALIQGVQSAQAFPS